jgi:ZIP family zinc transporter
MLPSSKKYLIQAGFSAANAEWTRHGCFVAGFIGIQVVARFLHRFIPSHVEHCDHSHTEPPSEGQSKRNSRSHSHCDHDHSRRHSRSMRSHIGGSSKAGESTPLLNGHGESKPYSKSPRRASFRGDPLEDPRRPSGEVSRRPSMAQVQSRVLSLVKDTKSNCDEGGPCFGYTDPCGQECFKRIGPHSLQGSRRGTAFVSRSRSATGNFPSRFARVGPEIPEDVDESSMAGSNVAIASTHSSRARSHESHDHACESDEEEDLEAQHHHHVPTNSFMSIGLQTSIAIALHKLPEGFITYATNHANPTLGFTVFMALFIHNITEGFAMALPLYLALGSRVRAMFWSAFLGGFSQPIGAGIAAVWFHLAKNTDHMPGFAVYGCMFAVTAGIMASVALSLFVEGLSVNHNSQLCIAFALLGMAILGISTALTH